MSISALPRDLIEDTAANPLMGRQALARESLSWFIRLLYGKAYKQSRFQRHFVSALESVERGEKRRVIIIVPPGHTKSTHGSVYFPAWFLGRNPNREVIATSYADQLVESFARMSRNLFYNDKWPFPDVKVDQSSSAVDDWKMSPPYRGGYRAAGVGGGITGRRADLLIIDDAVKGWQEAQSLTTRDHAWNWFLSEAYSRLQPLGAVVIIGTRWHEDDLIGRALQMPDAEWEVIHYPAQAEERDILGREPGEYLWPEYFPVWRYEEIKRDVGSTIWTTLFQGMPFPAEGDMFKRDNWMRYRSLPKLKRAAAFCDSSFKDGVQNDYSVFALWGDDGDGNYYVIDVWRNRVQFPELIRAGYDLMYKWRHKFRISSRYTSSFVIPLVVEDAASGQSAIQTWRRPFQLEDGVKLPKLNIIPYKVLSGASKVSRNEGVSPIQEARRVWLPQEAHWVSEFIDEHAAFPSGKHDDQVDTTGMALATFERAVRRGARSY